MNVFKIKLILLFSVLFFASCEKYDCENTDTTTLNETELENYKQQCENTDQTDTNTDQDQNQEPDKPDPIIANDTEAIGYYNDGSLELGEAIESRDGHVHKIFQNRGRSFGTREMLDLITDLSIEMKSQFPNIEKVQVGDIANQGGGLAAPNHKSHQNGLDVDIVYFSNSRKLQGTRNSYWTQYFVQKEKLVDFNLERNWEMFKFIVNNADVSRIFVDPVIKNEVCDYAKENGEFNSNIEVLRRLRPLRPHHETHLHLRLKCPEDDLSCINQAEPASGSGC